MVKQGKLQIGKQGLTDSFLNTLGDYFKSHKDVKISVLRTAGRDELDKYVDEILSFLGRNYTAKVIGFTIAVKKWRKEKR